MPTLPPQGTHGIFTVITFPVITSAAHDKPFVPNELLLSHSCCTPCHPPLLPSSVASLPPSFLEAPFLQCLVPFFFFGGTPNSLIRLFFEGSYCK
ncbi:hypothetical protein CEXT_776121 [Caerostris extrusa]|uniref:Uncharacterized protein n=1 Tax=Caerostris extrusa TaxID=172846 RepID=A0AAV4QGE4_CAEEX|nr:hypothetical protein CEXT_776121 [Caerostris extrusa]